MYAYIFGMVSKKGRMKGYGEGMDYGGQGVKVMGCENHGWGIRIVPSHGRDFYHFR